jgi:hypothetical protein
MPAFTPVGGIEGAHCAVFASPEYHSVGHGRRCYGIVRGHTPANDWRRGRHWDRRRLVLSGKHDEPYRSHECKHGCQEQDPDRGAAHRDPPGGAVRDQTVCCSVRVSRCRQRPPFWRGEVGETTAKNLPEVLGTSPELRLRAETPNRRKPTTGSALISRQRIGTRRVHYAIKMNRCATKLTHGSSKEVFGWHVPLPQYRR